MNTGVQMSFYVPFILNALYSRHANEFGCGEEYQR